MMIRHCFVVNTYFVNKGAKPLFIFPQPKKKFRDEEVENGSGANQHARGKKVEGQEGGKEKSILRKRSSHTYGVLHNPSYLGTL